MTAYIDVSFFVNFAFDAELLMILCKVYSKKISPARLFASAALGGLVGVFVFVPYLEILARYPARFIMPIFMVYIVFAPCPFKDFIGKYISFITVSFILSGAILFFKLGAFSGLLIPVPVYFAICILRKNIRKKRSEVILEYEDKRISAEGFYDSGNMLLSGGLPVILGNDRIFEKLLGCSVSDENLFYLTKRFNMRIIPFLSLGRSGTVMGIKLNRIWVDDKEYDNVVLAYAGNKFSDELILNSIMT